MNFRIEALSDRNRDALLDLQVKKEQQSYIESVAESLRDAEECGNFCPVGLYVGDDLVGFAMYGFFPEEGINGRVWLDRFLIDHRFQGKGIGKRVLGFLLDTIANIYACDSIYLSLYESNKIAMRLYQINGFQLIDEYDVNGEKIMRKQIKKYLILEK